MKISDEIMRIVGEAKSVAVPVTETSHLYSDLGYDSLSFVNLLLEIEEAYSIEIELLEMGNCLQIERLIALVEQKVQEAKYD